MQDLAPFHSAIARAVLDDLLAARGGLFTVEMADGAGVEELSSQLEFLVMALHVHDGGTVLKVLPAGAQARMDRLAAAVPQGSLHGLVSVRPGVVRLGRAECRYVTPEELGPQRGPVALIEVVEAQRLDRETYESRVAPLAAASGATVVLYGTPWNGETAFEQLKQCNREAEACGAPRRHFRIPWREAAAMLPGYEERATAELRRLGESHPAFQTRYELRPMPPVGRLLSEEQVQGLLGVHYRRRTPAAPGAVASVVITRMPRPAAVTPALVPAVSVSAVVTLAEEDGKARRVVDHRWLQAPDLPGLARRIARLLGETWRCGRVVAEVADGWGKDADQARHLLTHVLGAPVEWRGPGPGYAQEDVLALMAAANTGLLRVYAADGSPEYRMLRRELEHAVVEFRADGTMRVRLPEQDEGFLRGLALLARDAECGAVERTGALQPALAS